MLHSDVVTALVFPPEGQPGGRWTRPPGINSGRSNPCPNLHLDIMKPARRVRAVFGAALAATTTLALPHRAVTGEDGELLDACRRFYHHAELLERCNHGHYDDEEMTAIGSADYDDASVLAALPARTAAGREAKAHALILFIAEDE